MKFNNTQTDLAISATLYLLFGFLFATSRKIPSESLFFVNLAIWSLFLLNSFYFFKTIAVMVGFRKDETVDKEIPGFSSRVIIVVAVNILYIFILVPFIGFYFASAITCFCLMYFLSLRKWLFLTTIPILMPFFIYLIFEKILHIPFSRL